MKRILIFGNSGSGKSTLAGRLSAEHGIAHLDLDTVGWACAGVRKPFDESVQEIKAFFFKHSGWVVEGCYGSLLEVVAGHCSEIIFLNPGIETCLRHNLLRPWEPHKYDSKEAQDKNLDLLQNWVKEYEIRQDEYSLQQHRVIFEAFTGPKQERN